MTLIKAPWTSPRSRFGAHAIVWPFAPALLVGVCACGTSTSGTGDVVADASPVDPAGDDSAIDEPDAANVDDTLGADVVTDAHVTDTHVTDTFVAETSPSDVLASDGAKSDSIVVDSASAFEAATDAAGGPDPLFAAFTATVTPTTSFFDRDDSTTYNNLHRYRFLASDLSPGTTDGWTQLGTPLIGAGSGVHLTWHHNTNFAVSTTPQTIPVNNAVDASGKCLSGLKPESEAWEDIDATYVDYFAWSATAASVRVCAMAGTVTFVRETAPSERIKLTFDVEFGDGTLWTGKVFYAAYRKG